MTTFIILLRGVMPFGKNRVPMAKLREVLAKAGFGNARTYIASGNALVDTPLSRTEVEAKIHNLIKQHIGPDLVIVARSAAELQRVLDENPFTKGYDLSRIFYLSFATTPDLTKTKALLTEDFSPEKLAITSRAAYMYIPTSAARSRLSNNFLEKRLGVGATTRNANTLTKLIEMANERD